MSDTPTQTTTATATPATDANAAAANAVAQPATGTPPASQAAAPKAPTAAQVAAAKKRFQLKIDGVPEEVEFDPSNEEELKKQLQLARVGQKRMQQFAEYENNVKQLFELLQKDPIKVLGDPRLGITEETRKRMAEMIINNEIQEMQKTPEQKEKERLQREYESLKKQHEEEKKAREQAEFNRLQQQYTAQFDNEISDAIEKSGLPKTSRTVRYFAEAMMFAIQNGIELSASDLAPLIKKQTMNDFRELVGSLPDDEFEDFVGKDNISRLRKRSINRIKQVASTANQVKDTGAASSSKTKEDVAKISAKDFFKALGATHKGMK